jgi:hypothetical protein
MTVAPALRMSMRTKKLHRRELLAAFGAGFDAAFVGCSSSPSAPNHQQHIVDRRIVVGLRGGPQGQSPTSNAGDMVFADGVSLELASLAGSTASGYTATLTIGINA